MTSRDLTENVEQLQVRLSLEHVRGPDGGAARPPRPSRRRTRRAGADRAQPQRRRADHHAGQAVRDGGRRAARGVRAARGAARPLPAAGDQGPGRHGAGHARPAGRRRRASSPSWSERVAAHLGFAAVLTSVGQVYPRSLDYDVLTALVQLAAAPSSLATTIRLMAGNELVTEGFSAGPGRLLGHAAQDELPLRASGSTASRWCCAATRRWRPSWPARSGTRATCPARWSAGSRCPTRSSRSTACSRRSLTVLDEFGAYPAVIDARASTATCRSSRPPRC